MSCDQADQMLRTGLRRTTGSGNDCIHVSGTLEVLGGDGVTDRADGQVVGGVPGTGSSVKVRHLTGALGEQTRTEHVGEQVMVPVPGALVVQGYEEEIASLELLQQACAVDAGRDRVTKTPSHLVENGGPQQEVANLVGLACQDLVGEVVDDEAVAPLERLDEIRYRVCLLDSAEGKRRELEAGDPALGTLLERSYVVGAELESHHAIEELHRLPARETKVGASDLRELTPNAEQGQRQRRV
jgi:hypothetical protein